MSYILDRAFNGYLTKIANIDDEEGANNLVVGLGSNIVGSIGGIAPIAAGQAAIKYTIPKPVYRQMTYEPMLHFPTQVNNRTLKDAQRLARRMGWKSTGNTATAAELYPDHVDYNGRRYEPAMRTLGGAGSIEDLTARPGTINKDIMVDAKGNRLNISPEAVDITPGPHMFEEPYIESEVLKVRKTNKMPDDVYKKLQDYVAANKDKRGIIGSVVDFVAPKGAQPGVKTIRLHKGDAHNIGIAAHELGHSRQKFDLKHSALYQLGDKAVPVANNITGLASLATLAGVSDDTVDKIQLGSGILGTLGAAPMLATEVDASYKGYKAIPKTSHPNSRKLKMTAFAGVPSYLGIALSPIMNAGTSIWARHKIREKLEEQGNK